MSFLKLTHRSSQWILLICAFLGLSFMAGCAGKSVDPNDPASLYQEALDDIENDRYLLAVEKLRTVRNKFPYSRFAVEAQLKMADVYFLQESFTESALAYEAFRDLHPKHEKVPYAMFRLGLSYEKDVPDNIARDLTTAQLAIEAYQDYVRKFSGDENVDKARKSISELRSKLAQKEMYVGNFYLKQDKDEAAKGRFQRVIELYPDTQIANDAKEKLKEIEKRESKKGKST